MKKLIIIMLLCATNVFAKDHVLMVQRLSYWAPDYLTVTCNWDNLCFTQKVSTLKMFSVITAVNGESTKDMEPEDFYDVIDNNESFTLTYLTKTRGENKEYTKQVTKRKGKMMSILYALNESYTNRPMADIINDTNTDFFQYNTYDFLITDENNTGDKGLLTYIATILNEKGMINNPDNPDVYLCVSRDANLSVESVWVSKIVSRTKSKSYTDGGGVININQKKNRIDVIGGSSTHGNSKTVTEDEGEAKEIASGDMFFQVSMIDANKVKKNYSNPVVWQLTYSRHFTTAFTSETVAHNVVRSDVPSFPTTGINRYYLCYNGIFLDNHSGVVTDIIPGSEAEKKGVVIGDRIKKIQESELKRYKWIPGNGSPKEVFCIDIYFANKNKVPIIKGESTFDQVSFIYNSNDRIVIPDF